MRTHYLLLSTIVVFTGQAPAVGQSLADVATAETARRKSVTASSRVYTNDSLAPGAQQAEPPVPPAVTSKPDVQAKPAKPDEEAKTEKYWKGRMTSVQQGLARNKVLMEAMQSRINSLNAEALNIDDPGQRAIAQTNLNKAVGEMQRLTQESEKYNKDLTAIQDEARRVNVPPGWLR